MPTRRIFLKTTGQGLLAAGLSLGISETASARAAEDPESKPPAEKTGSVKWPYPIAYGKETVADVDVVVVGGGNAGCWAAISAARKGLKVALIEKGNPEHSGCNGSGVDHWQFAATNPCCTVAPEVLAQDAIDARKGYINGISRFIKSYEGWDRLQELEKMGMKIRDDEDEFKGAPFRDEKTKLLFAFNYRDNSVIRIWGTGLKPALTRECQRLGVKIFDRTMATSLLTEHGQPGNRVVGVTGVNTRTGEFLIVRAKATILTAAKPSRLWQFVDKLGISHHKPPVNSGDGFAMAWKAGAMFTMMEMSRLGTDPGVGMTGACSFATWYPCTLVDSNGKQVPWVDTFGNPVTSMDARFQAPAGQKRFFGGGYMDKSPGYKDPHTLDEKDIDAMVKKGELTLPLYADLPSMPEHERRVIFGLMVGQEGLTWIGYRTLARSGFDPNKDLLQVYRYHHTPDIQTIPLDGGGLVVDWDMRTNLEGLYAAGEQAYGTWGCNGSCSTGHWAGRKAAEYAKGISSVQVDQQQIQNEKKRVYAPVERASGVHWKDLENGVAKVMQDYCGSTKNEENLRIGNKWLGELNENEAQKLHARTPHELLHTLEAANIIHIGQLVVNSCMARKASSSMLNFVRSDYPLDDPPEWHKFVTVQQENGQVKVGELPIGYAGPLQENYLKNRG